MIYILLVIVVLAWLAVYVPLVWKRKQGDDWWRRYNAYLRSPEWKSRRAYRIWLSHGQCDKCASRRKLQVHHLPGAYQYLGREPMHLLETLCYDCHRAEHKRSF